MKENFQAKTTKFLLEIRWKQFIGVSILFVFFIGIWVLFKPFKSDIKKYVPPADSQDLSINLTISKEGSVLVDDKKVPQRLAEENGSEVLRYPILDSSGAYYNSVQIILHLPATVAADTPCEFLAIHGVGSASCTVLDERTISYSALDIAETATLSVVAKLPKSSLKLPPLVALYSHISDVKSLVWVLVAMLIPTLTFVYMLLFIAYRRRQEHIEIPNHISNAPPMAIPPALVGVLFHQKVGSREIAASLVDMANRGVLYIMDREHDFAFTKNRLTKQLLPYEKTLLSKIFNDKGAVSSRETIERRIGNHIYSKKISVVASEVYYLATQLGYFIINPQKAHGKYRTTGLLGLLIGALGLGLSFRFFPNPPFVIFFWIGMMIASLVVWIMARNIPIRSVIGQTTLSNWLAFKKFLSNSEKMPFSYDSQEIFQKYLPYAIVLDCEAAWARRFSEQNFTVPEWFISESTSLSLQDFCLSLFPIIAFISKSFEAIIEPGYE